eukprot:gene5252-7038_t
MKRLQLLCQYTSSDRLLCFHRTFCRQCTCTCQLIKAKIRDTKYRNAEILATHDSDMSDPNRISLPQILALRRATPLCNKVSICNTSTLHPFDQTSSLDTVTMSSAPSPGIVFQPTFNRNCSPKSVSWVHQYRTYDWQNLPLREKTIAPWNNIAPPAHKNGSKSHRSRSTSLRSLNILSNSSTNQGTGTGEWLLRQLKVFSTTSRWFSSHCSVQQREISSQDFRPLYAGEVAKSFLSDELSVALRTKPASAEVQMRSAIENGKVQLQPQHWYAAMSAANRLSDARAATRLWKMLLQHGTPPDELMHSIMIATYGRVRQFDKCQIIWERLLNTGQPRTAVSYDAMLLAASYSMRADVIADFFSQAREVDPGYVNGWMHLLRTYAWMNNPFACVAVLEEMSAAGVELGTAHLTKLLRGLSSLGLIKESEEVYGELLQMPDHIPSMIDMWLLRCFALMGQPQRILDHLAKCKSSNHSDATAVDDHRHRHFTKTQSSDSTAKNKNYHKSESEIPTVDDIRFSAAFVISGNSDGDSDCNNEEGGEQVPSMEWSEADMAAEDPHFVAWDSKPTAATNHETPTSSLHGQILSSQSTPWQVLGLSPKELTLLLQAYAMAGMVKEAQQLFQDLTDLQSLRSDQVLSLVHYEYLASAYADAVDVEGLARLIGKSTNFHSSIRPSASMLTSYIVAHLKTGDLGQCERVMRWLRRSMGYRAPTDVFNAFQALRRLRSLQAESCNNLDLLDEEQTEVHVDEELICDGNDPHDEHNLIKSKLLNAKTPHGCSNDYQVATRKTNTTGKKAPLTSDSTNITADTDDSLNIEMIHHSNKQCVKHDFRDLLGLDHFSMCSLASLEKPALERVVEERISAAINIVLHDDALTFLTLSNMCSRQLPLVSHHFERVIQQRVSSRTPRGPPGSHDLLQLMNETGIPLQPRAYGLFAVACWQAHLNSHNSSGGDSYTVTQQNYRLSDAYKDDKTSSQDLRDKTFKDESDELIDEFIMTYELEDVPTSIYLSALLEYNFKDQAWDMFHRAVTEHGQPGTQTLMKMALRFAEHADTEAMEQLITESRKHNTYTNSLGVFLLSCYVRQEAMLNGDAKATCSTKIESLFEELYAIAPVLTLDAIAERGALNNDPIFTQSLINRARRELNQVSISLVHAHMRALARAGQYADISRFVSSLHKYNIRATVETLRLARVLANNKTHRII